MPYSTHKDTSIFTKPWLVFGVLWLINFILYVPAARAGMVGDFPYWLEQVRTWPFWKYVHGEGFSKSMCEFTQLCTYGLYKILGVNAWAWHILFITLHSVNALLIYKIGKHALEAIHTERGAIISAAGAFLFIVSPMASEAVVWEPAFHFLTATMMILGILVLLQQYQNLPKRKYIIGAAFIFAASTFSLELFYITPVLTFIFAYYYFKVKKDAILFRKTLLFFVLPEIALVICNLILLHIVHHSYISHYGGVPYFNAHDYLSKPLKYVFHIIFFGRFFPNPARQAVYSALESTIVLVIFYLLCLFLMVRALISKNNNIGLMAVLATMSLMMLLYLAPLDFPNLFVVTYDRYAYWVTGFICLAIAFILFRLPGKIPFIILSFYFIISSFFTLKENMYWGASQKLINDLYSSFPKKQHAIYIQLNIAQCLNGIPMIGAQSSPNGGFRLMYNEFSGSITNDSVYAAAAFNMMTIHDGAHVHVLNDSMVRVTLNEWGNWWLYAGLGAYSYENEWYKVNMKDQGHEYELTLKAKPDQYTLLYQVGGNWKTVNWNNKETDQY